MKGSSRFLGRRELSQEERTVVEILRRYEDPGRLFAEAVADLKKERWMKAYGLRERKDRPFCIHSLTRGRRCSSALCRIPGADHTTLYVERDGRPKLIRTEPYHLGHGDTRKLLDFCEANGAQVYITSSSPYFPSQTLCVEIFRKGEYLTRVDNKEFPVGENVASPLIH